MSEVDTELEADQETDTDLVRRLRSEIRTSKKAVKDAEERAQANEQAALEALFDKAGVPEKAATFRRHYDGDRSVEAVKQRAVEEGILTDEQAAANNANAAEVAAQSQAMAGGEVLGEGEEDDFKRAVAEAAAKPGEVGKNITAVYKQYGRPYGMGE